MTADDTPRIEVLITPVWDSGAKAEIEAHVRELVAHAIEEAGVDVVAATERPERDGERSLTYEGQRWLLLGPADEPRRGSTWNDRSGAVWWLDHAGVWRTWEGDSWVAHPLRWPELQVGHGPMTPRGPSWSL